MQSSLQARRASTSLRLSMIVCFLVSLIGTSIASADELLVIVHPSRETSLSESEIQRIFLRQRRFWRDGAMITPVNQSAESLTRESFAHAVYDTSSRGHLSYWNRAYFRGLLPPITLDSDSAVRLFVASRPNAIGYIRGGAIDDSVSIAARLEVKD